MAPEALADPRVLALCARTRCEADPETAFPTYFSGGVEVELRDGRRLRRHVRVNRSAGERALGEAEVSAKFLAAAGPVFDSARAERARQAILALDRAPVREAARALAAP
nr:MmgE/PrpD family protein [Caldovatus aquaticus]